MKKYLEKLKDKPDEHKKHIAKTSAIIVTALIVIIWLVLTSLTPRTDEMVTDADTSFFDGFNTLIENGLSSFSGIQDQFEENPIEEILEEIEKQAIEDQQITDTENYETEQ